MESLNVSGMMKNKHLSKVIQQQKIYEFKRQIEYKSKLNGIEFIQVDKFYPSSKTCSCCGNIKKDLKLSDRMYKCDVCGLVIILDGNNTIRALLPLLSLGKDTARLNPKLSTSPIARKINLVGQTKLIIRRDLQR